MEEPADTHIHVHDLWRRYGRGKRTFDAVRGVSFTVWPGELFALLGTNGAGKTSTVELLEGLATPYRGKITLFGECDPVADRDRIRPRTGVMLQQGGFISHLTVRESVHMWAELTSRSRPVAEALALAGLTDRADVLVKNLSGGERRRLDLAIATLAPVELLFLDEPTAGMDAEGRHATWRLIAQLKEQGTHHPVDHPLPGGSGGARRSPRDHAPGADRRCRHRRRDRGGLSLHLVVSTGRSVAGVRVAHQRHHASGAMGGSW